MKRVFSFTTADDLFVVSSGYVGRLRNEVSSNLYMSIVIYVLLLSSTDDSFVTGIQCGCRSSTGCPVTYSTDEGSKGKSTDWAPNGWSDGQKTRQDESFRTIDNGGWNGMFSWDRLKLSRLSNCPNSLSSHFRPQFPEYVPSGTSVLVPWSSRRQMCPAPSAPRAGPTP